MDRSEVASDFRRSSSFGDSGGGRRLEARRPVTGDLCVICPEHSLASEPESNLGVRLTIPASELSDALSGRRTTALRFGDPEKLGGRVGVFAVLSDGVGGSPLLQAMEQKIEPRRGKKGRPRREEWHV